jgi:TolA-binding protein
MRRFAPALAVGVWVLGFYAAPAFAQTVDGDAPAAEPAAPAEPAEAAPPTPAEPEPATSTPAGTLSDPEVPKCERAVNWDRARPAKPDDKPSTSADDLAAQADRREYEESADRFARSARDYQIESYAVIEAAIDKQKDFVRRSYGKKTSELDVTERQRREDAIERFERFIERYPSNPDYTPDAMFRLAELYFERSGTRYADAEAQYAQDRKLFDRGQLPAEPVAPEREFKDTVRMYRTLIARFGSSYRYADAVYYLLGYVLAEQEDDTASREAWQTLAERFPKSEYAAEAWLRIGEMHFDYGEFENAAAAYLKAMEYTDNRFYDKALYKLGWTYFQLYDYDKAIRRFKELIAWYDAHSEGGGTASALREEAIDYLAGSLAEDDWDNDGLPDSDAGVARALRYVPGKRATSARSFASTARRSSRWPTASSGRRPSRSTVGCWPWTRWPSTRPTCRWRSSRSTTTCATSTRRRRSAGASPISSGRRARGGRPTKRTRRRRCASAAPWKTRCEIARCGTTSALRSSRSRRGSSPTPRCWRTPRSSTARPPWPTRSTSPSTPTSRPATS